MARKRKAKGNSVSVNFEGVEGRVLLPEGDYRAVVESVEADEAQSGNQYLKWQFKTQSDKPAENNKTLYYNTSLAPQALWNLRNLLETLGVEIPDGPMDLDLDGMPGLEIILSVEHEDYEGRARSKVFDFMVAGDSDEDEEEDDDVEVEEDEEEDSEEEDEDEEGDDDGDESDGYTEEEINEMDAADLKQVVKDNELDIKVGKRITAKLRKSIIDALREDDLITEGDDEDGEDESDGEGYSAEQIQDMDADGLAEVIEELELDVNLKKCRTLKKKQNAVIDALEENDLLIED